MPSNSTFEQLKARLTGLLLASSSFDDVGYRAASPKYATATDLLTGEGSRKRGGRWNPIGLATLYLSLTPETAMAETLAHNRYYGVPIEDAMPRVFVAIHAKLKRIIDLRIGAIRQRLGVSEARLVTVDWRKEVQAGRQPITQQIGKAACETGFEGAIVPSAVDVGGYNLLVFPINILPTSAIELHRVP